MEKVKLHQICSYLNNFKIKLLLDNIDELLIYFIRVKKFIMDNVYKSFEFSLTFVKSHSELYKNPSKADYEFTKKPDSPIIFLKNCDAQGRMIYIYRMKHFKDFDHCFFRKIFLTPTFVSYKIEALLNGFVLIVDCRDMNSGNFKKIPMNFVFDAFKISKHGAVKAKQIILIGMPTFLRPILNVGKTFASDKLLENIHLFRDIEELTAVMDVSLLPEEYGGSSNELLDFEAMEPGLGFTKLVNKFDVNFSQIQEYESVGSFRKLEID